MIGPSLRGHGNVPGHSDAVGPLHSQAEDRTNVNSKSLDIVLHYTKLNYVIFDSDFVIFGSDIAH